jgi:glucose dehydrogenase
MRIVSFYVIVCVALLVEVTLAAQQGAKRGEWTVLGGDQGYTKYTPLDQINKNNVKTLRVAWRRPSLASEFLAEYPEAKSTNMLQSTPVLIDGVMYASNGVGLIEAFDPATGKTMWVQELPKRGPKVEPADLAGQSSRSIGYWRNGVDKRLLSIRHHYLIATNPETGKPIREFGDRGVVDLGEYADAEDGVDAAPLKAGFKSDMYRWRSVPLVVRDTVIVGSSVSRPGDVRGYDVRTGKLKWTFHVVPHPGEFGHDTWLDGSWRGIQAGESDVWSNISADEELGLVYLPSSAPTNNMFGGHRPGANLFSSSLICLRADTGERVWHFQTVHHDIFDYDNPTAPMLIDIVVNEKPVKAVVQLTKQAMAFVLDRVTGTPIWPVAERPVPASTVPGEWTSPTQPFPTKPAPYDRQGVTTDDLIDFTPELRAEALKIVQNLRLGPVFTPPSLKGESPTDIQATLQLPGQVGGSNWGGGAFDPETNILYVPSRTGAFIVFLVPGSPNPKTNQRYRGTYRALEGPQGLPILKPPYGRITAINMNTGEHVWMVPNGDGPRSHPAIKHLNLGPLGQPGHGMPLVTKTLLFVSEGDPSMVFTPPGGGPDAGTKFRAYDKATGAVVWETQLPAGTNGSLTSYMHNGKQYIVIPIGSRIHAGEWVALSLP